MSEIDNKRKLDGADEVAEKKQKSEEPNNKRKLDGADESEPAEKKQKSEEPDNKRKLDSDQPNGSEPSEKKQKTETSEAEEEEEASSAPHFLHFKYITKEILKACVEWSEVYTIEGKCEVVYWNFNWEKFKEILGADCPDIEPYMSRLYSISSWLKTPFGYSPYQSDSGQIQNNLRGTLGSYIDAEGSEFAAQCKIWDEYILETALEKAEKEEWPIRPMFTLKPGKKLDIDLLEQKYKWIARPSKKAKYANYISFKFETQQKNEDLEQPEEKTTALVTVWNNQDKSAPEAEKLTEENIVPKKKEDRKNKKIIIDKQEYVKVIFCFQKLFFTADAFGPTLQVEEIIHDNEKNLRNAKAGGKKKCSFK